MVVLFFECWGSNLSIQAGVGKLNGDLHQPSRIRYESRSFSVRYLLSLAYWKGLISGVKLSVVVPQAIGISLHNRIGESIGEFLVVVLWGFYRHSMFLNFSYFFVSVSSMGACFPGSVWLVWSLSQLVCLPLFLYISLPIREFLTHSRVYMRLWLLYPCTYASPLRIVTYALNFSF